MRECENVRIWECKNYYLHGQSLEYEECKKIWNRGFFFEEEIILEIMRSISSNFASKCWQSGKFFECLHINNQYCVSSNSLAAILNLWMKSTLLSAFWASKELAPMEVPLRNNCFESWNCLSAFKRLQYSIIDNEKSKVSFRTGLLSIFSCFICFEFMCG